MKSIAFAVSTLCLHLVAAEPEDAIHTKRFQTFGRRWVREHATQIAQHVHGESLTSFREVEFPDEKTIAQYRVTLEGEKTREIDSAEKWARTLLVEKMIPADLRDRFIALKDIPTGSLSEWGKSADKLVAQYQIEKTTVEIQDDGMHCTILLKFPPLAERKKYDYREFILDKIKTHFRIPESEMETIVFDNMFLDGFCVGTIFFGKWSPFNFPGESFRFWDSFRQWWPVVSFATDFQSFFFVSFVEQDGHPNISPLPYMRYKRF